MGPITTFLRRGWSHHDIQVTVGQAWRSRAEHYLTSPATEPDPATWEVDVAYLTTQA